MATMYRNSAVTHESDDTRPGRALCGRSIIGAINLDTLTPWARVGLEASSNGPCQRCSVISRALTIHPDRSVALAYVAGWKASGDYRLTLEDAEDKFALKHNATEQDAFTAGWIDYASDYTYGTGILPVPVTTASEPTTAKDPTMARMNTLQTIAQGAQGDAAAAPAPLPRVAFSDAEAIARVMLCGNGIARGRGIVLDWADVPEELSEMIRDGVFGSRCVRLSTLAQDASEPDPIGPETRAYLTTLPRTPYVPTRATHARGR